MELFLRVFKWKRVDNILSRRSGTSREASGAQPRVIFYRILSKSFHNHEFKVPIFQLKTKKYPNPRFFRNLSFHDYPQKRLIVD